MMRPVLLLPLAFGLAALPLQRAHACGGMVLPEHAARVGGMREQEVLVVFQADRTVLLASAGYKGAGDGAAFILPVRSNPTEVHEADLDVFLGLDEISAPEVSIYVDDGSDHAPTGCAAAAKDGGAGGGGEFNDGAGEDINVLQRGTTASYEYAVVGGDTGTGVVDWLTDNGFSLPADYAAALDPYVADGQFFLAAKIKPGVADGALPPLELHLPPSEPEVFSIPFALAAHSLPPGETLTITTYLVAGGGLDPADAPAVHIDPNAVVATSPDETNYPDLYAEAVQDGGWVLDFSQGEFDATRIRDGFLNAFDAGRTDDPDATGIDEFLGRVDFTGQRITRLRTTLPADKLRDLTLRKVQTEDTSRSYFTTYNDNISVCTIGRRGVPLTAMMIPLLLLLRRRR